MRDLADLIRGTPTAIIDAARRGDNGFIIPAGDGGWAGGVAYSRVAEVDDQITTLVVRTYLSDSGSDWRIAAVA